VPSWLGWTIIQAGFHCIAPTWLAMAILTLAFARGRIKWPGRIALGFLAAFTLVSMRDVTAILHSCWGEVQHFPPCLLCS